MSKLQDLIKELCPDGVEFMRMDEVFEMRNGYTPSKANDKYWDNGTIPWFRMEDIRQNGRILSDSIQHITKEAVKGGRLFPANSFIIAITATIGEHALVIADSLANQRFTNLTIRKSLVEQILVKYLFYYLFVVGEWCKNNTNISGFASVDMSKFKKLEIPIPPLEVQNEIVRILDTFTSHAAELQAELQARKEQYEYYRNKLLTFDENDEGVKWMKLGDVTFYPKERISISLLHKDNYIGVDNLLPNKQGKKESDYVPSNGSCILYNVNDILIGNIRPYLKKIWMSNNNGGTNGDVLVFRLKDEFLNHIMHKYLYYLLSSDDFFNYDNQYAKGAKMPRGDKNMNMKYIIPIPSFSEQQRIVSILDKFESLVNDLTTGLPAEIAAVQEQYEYYRNKLLTFERKS